MNTTIIWYRNDLRIADHEPLHRALAAGDVVLPVYCFDPRQFGTTPFGFPKTGAFRAQFLLECIADLRRAWQALGADLVVRVGAPEVVLPAVAKEVGATRLLFHAEVTAEELAVERAVRTALDAAGVAVTSFWGHTLVHPDDLPFRMDDLPDQFTAFRKRVEQRWSIRATFPTPSRVPPIPPIDKGELPGLEQFKLVRPQPDGRGVLVFVGGEREAQRRVEHYFWTQDRLRIYKETRNGMLGEDYSSKFSPWLAHGCMSPRTILAEVQRYEDERVRNESTYWLVFELLWRDYFRFVARKYGNAIFKRPGLQKLDLPWSQDRPVFEQWCDGRTGYPLVDATMRELAATGFASNRGRQNVASFLTKNLNIDWRMGAEWFESLLLDYDVTSNWGNWLYTAGVGNDSRGFRFFNIIKQSNDYDPTGVFVKHWLPELKTVPTANVHTPWKLLPVEQQRLGIRIGVDYPAPVVDLFASAQANEQAYNRTNKRATSADYGTLRRNEPGKRR